MTQNKPVIAILGIAGAMGQALMHRITAAGYTVVGYDVRPPLDAVPPVSIIEQAQVVILAVPYVAEQHLATEVRDALAGRIVVSITNPLTPELNDVVTPHDESAAEHLAAMIPNARVVKALNTVSLPALRSARNECAFDTFVAADDREAARTVERIISDIGFRPWYVGGLILSRTLERMTALLIGIGMRYELRGIIGWKVEESAWS